MTRTSILIIEIEPTVAAENLRCKHFAHMLVIDYIVLYSIYPLPQAARKPPQLTALNHDSFERPK